MPTSHNPHDRPDEWLTECNRRLNLAERQAQELGQSVVDDAMTPDSLTAGMIAAETLTVGIGVMMMLAESEGVPTTELNELKRALAVVLHTFIPRCGIQTVLVGRCVDRITDAVQARGLSCADELVKLNERWHSHLSTLLRGEAEGGESAESAGK